MLKPSDGLEPSTLWVPEIGFRLQTAHSHLRRFGASRRTRTIRFCSRTRVAATLTCTTFASATGGRRYRRPGSGRCAAVRPASHLRDLCPSRRPVGVRAVAVLGTSLAMIDLYCGPWGAQNTIVLQTARFDNATEFLHPTRCSCVSLRSSSMVRGRSAASSSSRSVGRPSTRELSASIARRASASEPLRTRSRRRAASRRGLQGTLSVPRRFSVAVWKMAAVATGRGLRLGRSWSS